MRLWTLLCVVIAFVADVAAIVLLLLGHEAATLLVVIGSGAVVTVGAGVLLIIKPRPAAQVPVEPPISSPVVSPESLASSPAAPEPLELEPPDGERLDNRPWKKLVEETVALFDELDRHRADFDAPRQEVADHVICRLQEILERCGVKPISGDGNFDRTCHQPEGAMRVLPGATVTETLSPGFRVGRRILRRARVRVHNPAAPDPAS
jgi:hypothetical protein